MKAVPRVRRYLRPNTEDGIPFKPLTTMVNFFLEDIVQPNYLTDLELQLGKDFTNTTQLEESFRDDKSQWQVYTLGFIILLALGVLLAGVLLVLGPIITICICRDIGPFNRVLTLRPSTVSRSSWLIFGVLVVTVTVLMLLVVIPLFVMSTWIRHHSESTIFVKLIGAIQVLSAFLKKTAEELRDKSIDTIEDARSKAVDLLDQIPHKTILALDSTTKNQASKNVRRLHKIGTQELPRLQSNLEDAISMISASETQHEMVESAERSSLWQMSVAQHQELAQKLATLLTVVKMVTNKDSNTIPGSKPLVQQMSEINVQLKAMKANMAQLMNSPVKNIYEQMDKTESMIKKFVDYATSISVTLTSLIGQLRTLHDTVVPAINGVFAFLFIVCLMLLAITILHLTAFALYCPYWLPMYNISKREEAIKAGKTLFRIVVYTILLTAWLYWIIAAVFMYFAGQVHTEVCRHLTDPQGLRSRRVILILDAYLTSKLFQNSSRTKFRLLDTYVQCEKDEPIYVAGNVQSLWDLHGMFDLTGLRKATNDLLNVNTHIPHLNLQSSELKALMLRLEDLHNKMDIAGMSHRLNATALPAYASMTNTNTNRSQSSIPSDQNNQKLAEKLSQIAYDMSSYDFGNLSRGLEENQNIFRITGEETIRGVTGKIGEDVYNIFAGAVQKIQFEIDHNIGRCRPLYIAVKSALEEPCIQIIYPINGFWFTLGIANLILIPIFIISCKLSDFLEPAKSQEKANQSNTIIEPPQQNMANENQNSDQPQSRAKSPAKLQAPMSNTSLVQPQQSTEKENQNLDQPQSRAKSPAKLPAPMSNTSLEQPQQKMTKEKITLDRPSRSSNRIVSRSQ